MQKRKCYLASQVLFIPVTVFGDEDPEVRIVMLS